MAEKLRQHRFLIGMFVVYLAAAIGIIYVLRRPEPRIVTISTPPPRSTPSPVLIEVQVRGAVNQPGVYTFTVGARVGDAIDRAGARPEADLSALNLARKLNDGEDLFVPAQGPTQGSDVTLIPAAEKSRAAPTKLPSMININTASANELDTLPHIGPALAQRIMDYRDQNGPFQRIEDIKNVKGIGDAVFNDIKDLITLQ